MHFNLFLDFYANFFYLSLKVMTLLNKVVIIQRVFKL